MNILKQKLAELKEDLGDEKLNFKVSFTLNLPKSPVIEDVNNDPLREKAFQEVTLEGVRNAEKLLKECEIPYLRPPDMFVEMLKSEEQMAHIREDLEEQRKKKERIMAKNKQKREVKSHVISKEKKQIRPGISLKPKKNQKKELANRAKQARQLHQK